MRGTAFISTLATALALGGCTYDLALSRRPSHEAVQEARAMTAPGRGPIAIEWSPASFPDRVDVLHPSGSEGKASKAPIPIGPALAGRFDEVFDIAVGVDPRSAKVLSVTVLDASTEYAYIIGNPMNRQIGRARCDLDLELAVGETRWQRQFSAEARAGEGVRGTRLVEQAWDDVVLQVAGAVLESGLLDATVTPATTTAPVPSRDTRLEQLVEAWPRLNESTKVRILGIVEGAELADQE